MMSQVLLSKVSAYYTEKIRAHGATPKGVDWRDENTQNLRFSRLLDIIDQHAQAESISELGCGYGALLTYLRSVGRMNDYFGSDISESMVETARKIHHGISSATFELGETPHEADYVLASGIFNVRFDTPDGEWLAFVQQTIDLMMSKARRGIAFNCLTAYSDRERMDPRLYYSSPAQMLTWCIERYGRHVALRHDYGLYEYTMIVRKAPEDRL